MTKKTIKELREEFEVYFADLKASVERDGGSVSKVDEWQEFKAAYAERTARQ